MKKHCIIISFLFSFISVCGQTIDWEVMYEVPQGKKGIKGFTKLMKIDSNKAELYWRRGYEYFRTKQYNLAILDYNKTILKDSSFNYAQVLADRGLSKEMLGMFEDAISDFSKAIAYSFTQDTSIPQGFEKYYSYRGRIKFRLGDTTNAILDLDSSLNWWPQFYHARKFRAMLLAATGQYQKAMDDYNFLLHKWQGNGEFSLTKEYAINFYWRAITKQNLGDKTYLSDMENAEKLKYRKFGPENLEW
jgi:tetratricopeptide (TPR) repeat protein